ncbi:MAG TPA: penicillin acylase family protein, partial [Actinomycetota bacterium]|nr:penicillin acylase family protein [Actinomycetota bacterium]
MTFRRLVVAALAASSILAGMLPARASSEIRIVRDRFGVPHVYGETAKDVSYGAGYALAQDRLWQMHIFRLVAKGRLSHLLGPVIVAGDKTVRFWTYTAAERARRFETYPEDIKENMRAFAAGVTAWMNEVRKDPARLMPFEFAHFGEPLVDWAVDDSVAMSDYLIYTFGSGGGSELRNLSDLQALIKKFGESEGAKVFDDLVWTNDPDAPLTIPEDFDWRNSPSHARPEADEKGLTADARISLDPS